MHTPARTHTGMHCSAVPIVWTVLPLSVNGQLLRHCRSHLLRGTSPNSHYQDHLLCHVSVKTVGCLSSHTAIEFLALQMVKISQHSLQLKHKQTSGMWQPPGTPFFLRGDLNMRYCQRMSFEISHPIVQQPKKPLPKNWLLKRHQVTKEENVSHSKSASSFKYELLCILD